MLMARIHHWQPANDFLVYIVKKKKKLTPPIHYFITFVFWTLGHLCWAKDMN